MNPSRSNHTISEEHKKLFESYIDFISGAYTEQYISDTLNLLGDFYDISSYRNLNKINIEIDKVSEEIDSFNEYEDVEFSDCTDVRNMKSDLPKTQSEILYEPDEDLDGFEDMDSMFGGDDFFSDNNNDHNESESSSIEDAPNVRQLFRMISSISHPDKIRNTHDRRSELIEVFIKASSEREDKEALIEYHAQALYWNKQLNKVRNYHIALIREVVERETTSLSVAVDLDVFPLIRGYRLSGLDVPKHIESSRISVLDKLFYTMMEFKLSVLRELKLQLKELKKTKS